MTEEEQLLVEAARRGLLPGGVERPTAKGLGDAWLGVGKGIVRGAKDFEDGTVQLTGRALQAMMPSGSGAESFIQNEVAQNEAKMKAGEQDYQAGRGKTGFDGPRLIGNVATMAPIGLAAPATMVGGIGAGALTNVMQPTDVADDQSYWGQKLKQAGLGAAFGGAGTAAGKAVSRIAAPKSSPEIQALMEEGVRPSPGQMMGGWAQRLEEGLTSIPIVGDVIKGSQRRAVEGFNRGAINKALEPIGETLDPKTLVGREAIGEAQEKVSKAYTDLLPKVTFTADMKFLNDIATLQQMSKSMPAATRDQFETILTENVLKKLNPATGNMTGETLKEVESELGRLAKNYSSSAVGSERDLGNAIRELQGSMRSTLMRTNPDQAARLKDINTSYATLVRVEDAAGRAGSKDGVFSPNALNAAARKGDSSTRKRSFARGDALMQDYAEAGQSVLGPRVPDSGTPMRAASMAAVFGGLPTLGAAASLPAGLGIGAALVPYTPWGQRAFARAVASRPEWSKSLGGLLDNVSPAIGAATVPAANGLLE